MSTARERYARFRRTQPRTPPLARREVVARGLTFATYASPPIEGATPLVCVNGGLVYDHRLLWPAMAPLAARRQVVLYDQRGRGRSQAPPGLRAARIEHDAGDLGAIREALGIPRWDVLGHSWGGGVAMLGTADDQEGVRRLVTVNAVGPTSAWLERLHHDALARLHGAERDRLAAAWTARAARDQVAEQSEYGAAMYPAWFHDAELGRLFEPPPATSETGAAVSARLRREGYDWRETLRALSVPTLVLHGERDLLPPTVARELADLLQDARLALVPDAGHMPFWEQPAMFFSLVDEFLLG